jgi:hypothetical protein
MRAIGEDSACRGFWKPEDYSGVSHAISGIIRDLHGESFSGDGCCRGTRAVAIEQMNLEIGRGLSRELPGNKQTRQEK